MSNTFDVCANGAAVISSIAYQAATYGNDSVNAETIHSALARLAELTAPTVTPEQRNRLDWTLTGNYPGFSDRHHAIVADLVIDALDLKAAEPQPKPAGWLAAPIDRARGAAATWRHENGFDEILDDDLDELTDLIIDALSYQPADAEPVALVAVTPSGYKPYRCTECYTTGHTKVGRCVNGHDVDTSPAAAVNYLKIGSSDQGAPPWIAAEPPAPTPEPVVELDADDLRHLADAIDSCRRIRYEGICERVEAKIVLTGGAQARILYNADHEWVLRIGGE